MNEWHRGIQRLTSLIDDCILHNRDESLTLRELANALGCSDCHLSRKFHEITGMQLRDYLRFRRLAFALRDLRDTPRTVLDIALDSGFSSHEAFTRAFRAAYGMTPIAYRRHPVPVAVRTLLRPLDCYIASTGGANTAMSTSHVKTYFISIPAHKFLHIRNYESIGYWDFWQKQSLIPGQDCDTVCGLLDSIPGKLDDAGGTMADSSSGQIMAFLTEPEGRLCSWGYPLAECYGVRLPSDWQGEIPPQMILTDVPEGDYIVFEHGPFDFETENAAVEAKIEQAMSAFDYAATGYHLDMSPGRFFYFFHDCSRFWKYVRPVIRT